MVGIFEKDLTIINKKGLHARAAATFVKTVEAFDAKLYVSRGAHEVSGDSIMGLMMLAASEGSIIHLRAEGPEAQKMLESLSLLVNARFGEET